MAVYVVGPLWILPLVPLVPFVPCVQLAASRVSAVRRLGRRSRGSSGVWKAIKVALLATFLCTAFVGPPRERQPSLWDAPKAETRAEKPDNEPDDDDKLAKRVRAIAIGSAGGILLSLAVQSVLRPEPPNVPQAQLQRSSQGFSEAGPDLNWVGTLSTGVVIGLGVGFNVGTKQQPSSESQEKQHKDHKGLSRKISADKLSELQSSQTVKLE